MRVTSWLKISSRDLALIALSIPLYWATAWLVGLHYYFMPPLTVQNDVYIGEHDLLRNLGTYRVFFECFVVGFFIGLFSTGSIWRDAFFAAFGLLLISHSYGFLDSALHEDRLYIPSRFALFFTFQLLVYSAVYVVGACAGAYAKEQRERTQSRTVAKSSLRGSCVIVACAAIILIWPYAVFPHYSPGPALGFDNLGQSDWISMYVKPIFHLFPFLLIVFLAGLLRPGNGFATGALVAAICTIVAITNVLSVSSSTSGYVEYPVSSVSLFWLYVVVANTVIGTIIGATGRFTATRIRKSGIASRFVRITPSL